jgi:hypothetical protein
MHGTNALSGSYQETTQSFFFFARLETTESLLGDDRSSCTL